MPAAPLDRPARTEAAARIAQAIVQDSYGTVPGDVLRLSERAVPAPGPGQVRVRVRAAGVDRGVWHLMSGLPYLMRVVGFGLRAPKQATRGLEFAGTIDAVGEGAEAFAAGDEVFGIADGSFAEYALAPVTKVAPKPANLTFEQAAALPISGLAALQAVRDQANVLPGERVLVLGASGGVGSLVVQIAKALGAVVTGVASARKLDLVSALGADRVLDYASEDPTRSGEPYDVVIDTGGNRRLSDLRRALAPRGRLVIVGGEGGGRLIGGTDRQVRAMLLSPFVGQTLGSFISSENAADLETLRELAEAGRVTPAVERAYPLAQAAAAVAHMSEGRARGKVVITT